MKQTRNEMRWLRTLLIAGAAAALTLALSCKLLPSDVQSIPDPTELQPTVNPTEQPLDTAMLSLAAAGDPEALAKALLLDTANVEKYLTKMCEILGLQKVTDTRNDSSLTRVSPGVFQALAASIKQHRRSPQYISVMDMGVAMKLRGAKTTLHFGQSVPYDTTYFLQLMQIYDAFAEPYKDLPKGRVARFMKALAHNDPMRPDTVFPSSVTARYVTTLQAYLMVVDALGKHPGFGLYKGKAEGKDYFGFGQEIIGQLIDLVGKVNDATGIIQGTIVADGTRVKVSGPTKIMLGGNSYTYTIKTWFEYDYGNMLTEYGWVAGVDVPKPGPLKARVKADLSELCPGYAKFSEGDPMLMTWMGGFDGGGVSSGDGGQVIFGVTTNQDENGQSCKTYENRIIIEVSANAQEWLNWAQGIGSTLFPKYDILAIFVTFRECTNGDDPNDPHK